LHKKIFEGVETEPEPKRVETEKS
jgi:hypothetical protein